MNSPKQHCPNCQGSSDCPSCRGTGRVSGGILPEAICATCNGSGRCSVCSGSIRISHSGRVIEASIQGANGEEVAKVVATLVKDEAAINISNSAIGFLNAGEIAQVGSVSANASALAEAGSAEIAQALRLLTKSIAESEDLASEQRSEALDLLEELSAQAVLPKDERLRLATLRAAAETLAGIVGAAASLGQIWSMWGQPIRTFFGI